MTFELKSIRLYRTPDQDNPEGLIGEIHLNNVDGLSLSFPHGGIASVDDAAAMVSISQALINDKAFMGAFYKKSSG